jgi:hypothetical protein
MNSRSIICLEVNEVPLRIFDYYVHKKPDSTLARIMNRSSQYRTHAEDKARFIMPWTTWPSFHRGVNDEQHQIFNFGQWEAEAEQRFPPIWKHMVRNGIRVGVFSSMQCSPLPDNASDYAFYFPDMFSTDSSTHPEDLRPLQEFSLAMTRESARNVSRRIDWKHGVQLLRNSRQLGIRPETYLEIGKQLVSELVDDSRKTRRRSVQPILLLDTFLKRVEATRPQFSTFFTNHVAAAMHRYWAAAFPGDYAEFNLDQAWVDKYKDEIEYAMGKLDQVVQRLSVFVDANPDYMLVIASSMGQAAIPASHVKEFLTITNLQGFLQKLGLEKSDVEERPAMVPDFSFSLKSAQKANEIEAALATLSLSGKLAEVHRDGLFFHVNVYDERPGLKYVSFKEQSIDIADIGMGYMIHEDEVSCTAQHVPEGTLMIYSPHAASDPVQQRQDISALEFAPAALRHFGIDIPSYMKNPAIALNQ